MKMPDIVEMLKAGLHFGHQTSRRHPKMEEYIFTTRNGVNVIDLEKTKTQLESVLSEIKSLASQGKVILFIGTKSQARQFVGEAAQKCGMPYLTERWIGGLLTNFPEVKNRLKKYKELKEEFATGEIEKYTKKEIVSLKKKLEKMDKYLAGLVDLEKMPDVLYVASLHNEKTAIKETQRTGTPIIAVCDTNSNPTKADYVIPANDDAVNSIKMIVDLVSEAVIEGKQELEANKPKEEKRNIIPKKPERKVVQEESV